jgi:hypothetical protein
VCSQAQIILFCLPFFGLLALRVVVLCGRPVVCFASHLDFAAGLCRPYGPYVCVMACACRPISRSGCTPVIDWWYCVHVLLGVGDASLLSAKACLLMCMKVSDSPTPLLSLLSTFVPHFE